MDTKRLITGMVVVMAVMLAWEGVMYYLQRSHPEWFVASQTTSTAPAPSAATQPSIAAAPAPSAVAGAQPALATAPSLAVQGAQGPGTPATLGSAQHEDPQYT